jgi:hypothetical protein
MQEPVASEAIETLDDLRVRAQELEATIASMRPIVLRVAEARMCRDNVTMTESCPHCSLQRSSALGYAGAHEKDCIVTRARALGF